MTNTQRTLNTVDHAIQLHMQLLEHHLVDMHDSIATAQQDIIQHKRNAAIGALLRCEEAYTQIGTLYQAILALHRSAYALERPKE
jgi:hypothetical protein